ncbi:uncharacterized protein F5891DRAFT_34826 [Suillus fuscotomentosus]|uniref:Uncharacterized protein n=1 Tax=Suillus fuscotomentosus TaxID=1912939 RepID=A0AAD4EFW0_9AGAM|nr:uncharacterized protein F5891DRAFT_34826 [Suillus fuscotomentosus]KAG1904203.1 hypothetical protein F5891DRAFT_34826 [Suillus fuscotomentosus]
MISIYRRLLVPTQVHLLRPIGALAYIWQSTRSEISSVSSDWISLDLVALTLQLSHAAEILHPSYSTNLRFGISPILKVARLDPSRDEDRRLLQEWLIIPFYLNRCTQSTQSVVSCSPRFRDSQRDLPSLQCDNRPLSTNQGPCFRLHESFKDQRKFRLYSNQLLCRPEIDVRSLHRSPYWGAHSRFFQNRTVTIRAYIAAYFLKSAMVRVLISRL